MAQSYMMELPIERRRELLEDNAESRETALYFKKLSQEELDLRREQHTDNSIKLSDLSDELKDIKADFKDRMDPLTIMNSRLIQEVKTGQAQVEGVLYHVSDQDTGMMETFNQDGELISSRRLKPEERQTRAFLKKVDSQF